MMVSRRGQLESLQHEGKDVGIRNQYYIKVLDARCFLKCENIYDHGRLAHTAKCIQEKLNVFFISPFQHRHKRSNQFNLMLLICTDSQSNKKAMNWPLMLRLPTRCRTMSSTTNMVTILLIFHHNQVLLLHDHLFPTNLYRPLPLQKAQTTT